MTPPTGAGSVASSANYQDLRVGPVNLENRFNQMDSIHGKQASHDSTGSRSSGHGSMEGHASEGQVSRGDTISSEGFVSGDDRHQRQQAYKESTEGKFEDFLFNFNFFYLFFFHIYSCFIFLTNIF